MRGVDWLVLSVDEVKAFGNKVGNGEAPAYEDSLMCLLSTAKEALQE